MKAWLFEKIRGLFLWLWQQRKKLAFFFAILFAFIIWLMFPQPITELWPPKQLEDKNIVYVCVKGTHTLITFPDYNMGCFQEWHFGVYSWYLKRDFDNYERVMSFFKPISGVIRFGVFSLNYWNRTDLPKQNVYKFWLSKKGMHNLQTFLHSWRGTKSGKHGKYWYYLSRHNWHPLRNCNAFVGGALRAAGLPVRSLFSIEGLSMTWQLERCNSFQEKWLTKH